MIRIRLLLLFILFSCYIYSQSLPPATEIRAVWLATNWGLDWPSQTKTLKDQKADLCSILDKLNEAKINTVFFQTRIRGDVFYRSQIEAMSPYFTNSSSNEFFDPLSFAIEECHKRGLECHAWFVVYPLGSEKYVKGKKKSPVFTQKKLCKLYRGEWYLDPGTPETRKYILSLVNEVVSNYDIDGIHFDYIRYPENDRSFPDSDSFAKYGKGKTLADWRRENITALVREIYKSVKNKKNWVQVSSSPLGRYRPLPIKPNDGWTASEDVFQEAGRWLQEGIHDAIYPMMYYKDELFYPYLEDWLNFKNNRIIVPGIGAYMMLPSEKNWDVNVILDQMNFIRDKKAEGQSFYRVANILENTKGILDKLKKEYYQYPAKLTPLSWLNDTPPTPPINLEVFKTPEGTTCLKWDSSVDESTTYNLYCSFSDNIDINDPRNIVVTNFHDTQVFLSVPNMETGVYYTVTASDRYHNESEPCESAYFVHSSLIK